MKFREKYNSGIFSGNYSENFQNNLFKYSLSYNLFGFLPLLTYKKRGGKEVWKILGIPILKVRTMENIMVKKYYFLNLLILKMVG